MTREGVIVDTTLIAASPSTKTKDGESDPELHQSKKGNDGHFGIKIHVGVAAASGSVHTFIGIRAVPGQAPHFVDIPPFRHLS